MKELLQLILESLSIKEEEEFQQICMRIKRRFQELKIKGKGIEVIDFLRQEYLTEREFQVLCKLKKLI